MKWNPLMILSDHQWIPIKKEDYCISSFFLLFLFNKLLMNGGDKMTRDDVIAHNNDIRKFIKDIRYKMLYINKNQITKVKKALRNVDTPVTAPYDASVYESMMEARINTLIHNIDINHSDLPITATSVELPINDLIGWVEMMIIRMKRFTNTSYYIDYKKYLRKSRSNVNVEKNVNMIFELQKELVTKELEYVVKVVSMIPDMLKKARDANV